MEARKRQKLTPFMFSEEELKDLGGLKRFEDHIELTCGCTSVRYGDAVGKLRVYKNGELQITCECTPGCDEGIMTPAAFEKHATIDKPKKWKKYVWVFVDGDKVPLCKTSLLRYYDLSLDGKWSHRPMHRDEFVKCTKCKKLRRFRMKNKVECRNFHDAVLNSNWKCADHSYSKLSCETDEERASRIVLRGCPRLGACSGCTKCVCCGCNMCRYKDCSCQICMDFVNNAGANNSKGSEESES